MKKIPVGRQVWSSHDDMQRDFAATVAGADRIGCHGVELADCGNLPVHHVKAALDAVEPKVAGLPVGYSLPTTNSDAVIADALFLGTRHMTCPSSPAVHYLSPGACEPLKYEKELGRGPVNFPGVFSAIAEIGAAESRIVEQENDVPAPLESVRRCFEQRETWDRI